MSKMNMNYKDIELTNENEYNLVTGGECSVFDVLIELKNAFF
jgi:hypothetical protein